MNEQAWHRRHAVMLASQLPEKYEDAAAVLRCVERLLQDYLRDDPGLPRPSSIARGAMTDEEDEYQPRAAHEFPSGS
jgi:hypothetical protein